MQVQETVCEFCDGDGYMIIAEANADGGRYQDAMTQRCICRMRHEEDEDIEN